MQNFCLIPRVALLGALCLVGSVAQANGEGTLNDSTLTLSYEGGPLVAPNPLVLAEMPPIICGEVPLPTCDIYTLTVDFSDDFRKANAGLQVSFNLAFEGDWDMWMNDSSGAQVSAAAGTDNPEVISARLSQLPNGVYTFEITPFFPETTGFVLTVDASDGKNAPSAGKSGSGLALGAFGWPALLALFGLALTRRKR